MNIAHVLVALCLSAIFAASCKGGAATTPAAPVSIATEQSFRIEIGGARPTIELQAGGRKRPALFDTGAENTVISPKAAADLGLIDEGPLPAPFNQTLHEGYRSTLRGASIDGVDIPDTEVLVMALPIEGYDAIVSPTAFAGRLVTLDFGNGVVRLRPLTERNALGDVSSAYSGGAFNIPALPVRAGDRTFDAHLDTGSPVGLILPQRMQQGLEFLVQPERVGEARSHFGAAAIYKATLKGAVMVGPLQLNNPEIHITDAVPNANVGLRILRQLEVTLDPEGKQLWVRAAGEE